MEAGSAAAGSAASTPLLQVVGSEGEATTSSSSSCRPLAEVLAWSGTSTETHDVSGEEEGGTLIEVVGVAPHLLDAGEVEVGNDTATASRGAAGHLEGSSVGDGTPAGGPGGATTGESRSGAALPDLSPGMISGVFMNSFIHYSEVHCSFLEKIAHPCYRKQTAHVVLRLHQHLFLRNQVADGQPATTLSPLPT